MEGTNVITSTLSWTAVVLLCLSYWFQIWKIHVHKEVRDLSMIYHIIQALGFAILAYTAWVEQSMIFLAKQVASTIPVMIIIGQIIVHKDDHWHDDADPDCSSCGEELEIPWNHCPYCGAEKTEDQKQTQSKFDLSKLKGFRKTTK